MSKLYELNELNGHIKTLGFTKGKEKKPFIQRLILSACAEIHRSGNHTPATQLVRALNKAQGEQVVKWFTDNTWLYWKTNQNKSLSAFAKDSAKSMPTMENLFKVKSWHADADELAKEKSEAKKAEAEADNGFDAVDTQAPQSRPIFDYSDDELVKLQTAIAAEIARRTLAKAPANDKPAGKQEKKAA